MTKLLAEKVVIVTGASRGLGRVMAVALAEEGATLVLAARTVPDLEETAAMVRAKGTNAISVPTDLADTASVENLLQQCLKSFGRVDVLVNNAAVNPSVKGAEKWTVEEWEQVIRVNLIGVFACTLAVGRQMIANGGGSIVNIASYCAEVPVHGQVAYSTSKAGVVHLTRALAVEWAKHGVRVNAVAPGTCAEGMSRELIALGGRYQQYVLAKVPMGRFGRGEEIANAVAFLASGKASYITGQTLFVDGGAAAM